MRVHVHVLVCVLLLVAPSAFASSTERVEGTLRWEGDAHARGVWEAVSEEGTLDLTEAVRAGEPLRLGWRSASGYVVSTEWTRLRHAPEQQVGSAPEKETFSLSAATADTWRCGPACRVLLYALPEGQVGARGTLDGALRPLGEEILYSAEFAKEGARDAFRRLVPAEAFAFGGREAPGPGRVHEFLPTAAGRVALFLHDAAVPDEDLDAMLRREPLGPSADLAVGERVTNRFIVLELEDAWLEASPGSRATLLAPRAEMSLAGSLQWTDAAGELRVGDASHRLVDEPLLIEGDFAGALVGVPAEERLVAGAAPALALRFAGEASLVAFGDGRVVDADDLARASLLALGTLAAALAVLHRVVVPFLYTRIKTRRLLDHPTRRSIHDHVRAHPGQHALEIARALGLARMVVQHHLRILCAHAALRVVQDGRLRIYAAPAGAARDDDLRLARLLDMPARRAVAARVAADEPPTQRDLCEATGLSQRLVSYHLRHLAEADLVEELEARPRRYRARPKLEAALRASEAMRRAG